MNLNHSFGFKIPHNSPSGYTEALEKLKLNFNSKNQAAKAETNAIIAEAVRQHKEDIAPFNINTYIDRLKEEHVERRKFNEEEYIKKLDVFGKTPIGLGDDPEYLNLISQENSLTDNYFNVFETWVEKCLYPKISEHLTYLSIQTPLTARALVNKIGRRVSTAIFKCHRDDKSLEVLKQELIKIFNDYNFNGHKFCWVEYDNWIDESKEYNRRHNYILDEKRRVMIRFRETDSKTIELDTAISLLKQEYEATELLSIANLEEQISAAKNKFEELIRPFNKKFSNIKHKEIDKLNSFRRELEEKFESEKKLLWQKFARK